MKSQHEETVRTDREKAMECSAVDLSTRMSINIFLYRRREAHKKTSHPTKHILQESNATFQVILILNTGNTSCHIRR